MVHKGGSGAHPCESHRRRNRGYWVGAHTLFVNCGMRSNFSWCFHIRFIWNRGIIFYNLDLIL